MNMYTIHEGRKNLSGNVRVYEYNLPNKTTWNLNNNSEVNNSNTASNKFKCDFKTNYNEQEIKQHIIGESDSKKKVERYRMNSNRGLLEEHPGDNFKIMEKMDPNKDLSRTNIRCIPTNKYGEKIRDQDYNSIEKNKCKLNIKDKKVNLGGFRDPEWYKQIPDWEKIIEERYTTVYSSYERLEMIGTGTYAKVWLLKDKITNRKYAGKLLEPHTYPSDTVERIERMFQSEIENLIISQCPGVVRLHKIVVGPEGCLLVQDYVDDGTIWRENCCVSELEAFQHFIQLIQSVLYFQDKGVVHRDLKPTNILRYSNKTIVIGDFGWSEKTKKLHLSPSEWPGTLEINPPEVLTFKGPLTEKIDNYAVGMNLLLFLTGRFICRQKGLDVTEAAPYILKVVELIRSDFNNKILNKNKQKGTTQPKQSQYFMWEIFIGFTDPNPNTRWTIKKALFHPDCIQQLLYCFHNNFSALWHPQIIAIIKSNIIPNNISDNQIFIEDNKKYVDHNKKNNYNKNLNNNHINQNHVISHFHAFNNGFNYFSNFLNSTPSNSDFQKNYYKHLGASLKTTNFNLNQSQIKNDVIQPKMIINSKISASDNFIYNSELASSFRNYPSTSSPSVNLNYLNNNQKYVNIDNSIAKQSQYINNFHY